MNTCNSHYIVVNACGHITDGWSDGPRPDKPTDGATLLRGDSGYQFRLYPSGAENQPLTTMNGTPLYRWDGAQVVERTEEEIAAEEAATVTPPTTEDLTLDLLAEHEERLCMLELTK